MIIIYTPRLDKVPDFHKVGKKTKKVLLAKADKLKKKKILVSGLHSGPDL